MEWYGVGWVLFFLALWLLALVVWLTLWLFRTAIDDCTRSISNRSLVFLKDTDVLVEWVSDRVDVASRQASEIRERWEALEKRLGLNE